MLDKWLNKRLDAFGVQVRDWHNAAIKQLNAESKAFRDDYVARQNELMKNVHQAHEQQKEYLQKKDHMPDLVDAVKELTQVIKDRHAPQR